MRDVKEIAEDCRITRHIHNISMSGNGYRLEIVYEDGEVKMATLTEKGSKFECLNEESRRELCEVIAPLLGDSVTIRY